MNPPSPRTADRPDLSVVVASYNTRDLLHRCLATLSRALEGYEAEVFVVDNDSADGSAEMVAADFPEVRLLRNERNEGFARANNRALRESRGRRVLLLNPDTEVPPETLRALMDHLDQHEDVGMVGPRLERPDGTLDQACRRGFPTLTAAACRLTGLDRLFPRARWAGQYRRTFTDPYARQEVDSLVGAFMLLRRQAFEEVGGLDEDFFMFGEDLDWCWRMKGRDWRVVYLGDVRALHHKNAAVRSVPQSMNWHFHRSMVVFHNKHLESRYPFFVNWAVYGAIGVRMALKSAMLAARGLRARQRG